MLPLFSEIDGGTKILIPHVVFSTALSNLWNAATSAVSEQDCFVRCKSPPSGDVEAKEELKSA